ncbi:hypothetical protein [Adhaeribacter rhizoryzae]|uniref:Uncharacterized protein n=1 Tax=Adhaeribacter rhizoryzae TaxID=2607907 RepID=A0A5M6CYN0_9BACT|nr:hypothetical protein [Adhaeribacter rhizoryzae]KAA5539986.1 hypothetical protein F0145_23655 [Adhaeribacter rhizoryzae]
MMKDFAIEYSSSWQDNPMAYWVHIEQDNQHWHEAEHFIPPAPERDLRGLYKIYKVKIDGFTFKFSSLEQLEHCIEILSMGSLPITSELCKKRPGNEEANEHWLCTLPSQVKSRRYRQKAVKYLRKVRGELINNR